MKTLLASLERYGIGTRALTEDDFYLICEDLEIEVIHSKEKFAFFFAMLGQKFIVLPRRRKGLRWLFSAFHELGHALAGHAQHSVHAAFHGLETQHHDKNEVEADTIALVALIPKHRIDELATEYGSTRYGDRLWRERCRIMFIYGI